MCVRACTGRWSSVKHKFFLHAHGTWLDLWAAHMSASQQWANRGRLQIYDLHRIQTDILKGTYTLFKTGVPSGRGFTWECSPFMIIEWRHSNTDWAEWGFEGWNFYGSQSAEFFEFSVTIPSVNLLRHNFMFWIDFSYARRLAGDLFSREFLDSRVEWVNRRSNFRKKEFRISHEMGNSQM